MSLFLILLAAGDSKRLKSNTPKPYNIINNKTVIEHSLDAFKNFDKIKKTIIVFNKKHKNHLNKLKCNKMRRIKLYFVRRKNCLEWYTKQKYQF